MTAYFIRSVLEFVCGALFRMMLNSAPPPHTHANMGLIKYAATPPIQPRQCILTDYFNNYNFSKAQIIRSLMMVIKPKRRGCFNVNFNTLFKQLYCASVGKQDFVNLS